MYLDGFSGSIDEVSSLLKFIISKSELPWVWFNNTWETVKDQTEQRQLFFVSESSTHDTFTKWKYQVENV